MIFDLTDEQKMIQDMARDFAAKEVAPKAAEIDKNHRYPAELVAKMAELGLMGMMVPEDQGGAGMDTVSYVIALEEISAACASTGVIMSVNNSLVCDPLQRNCTPEQVEKFLKPLASGQKLGCFGLTEPNAGSDAAGQKTTAVPDGDSWVLNGSKNFITNGNEADTAIVFAMTDKEQGTRGISAFVVEKGTPGFSIGKLEDKLGICGSSTAELVFEDCRIPKDNRQGRGGLQDRHGHAGRGPHRHRVPGAGHRPRRAQRIQTARPGPRAVRQAHRAPPGNPVDDCGHGHQA
jgi:butyryl-CoA dehydrogenase